MIYREVVRKLRNDNEPVFHRCSILPQCGILLGELDSLLVEISSLTFTEININISYAGGFSIEIS